LRKYYSGKVVARFYCDKVEKIFLNKNHFINDQYSTDELDYEELLEQSCLTYRELDDYLQCEIGCAIHISNLEIFDKPKELSEFRKYYRSKGYPQNQSWYLTKAPQSWCYIEVDNE
jgi:predicted transcriptional regulator